MKSLIIIASILFSSLVAQANDICLSIPHNMYLVEQEILEKSQSNVLTEKLSQDLLSGQELTCNEYKRLMDLQRSFISLGQEFLSSYKAIKNEGCAEAKAYEASVSTIMSLVNTSKTSLNYIHQVQNAAGCW